MSSFLKNSRPQVSCKKGILKIKTLQDSLKNIRDVVFNLTKIQAKGQQLYWKETSTYALSLECWQTATSQISSKNQNATPVKFSGAAGRRNFSKWVFHKILHR